MSTYTDATHLRPRLTGDAEQPRLTGDAEQSHLTADAEQPHNRGDRAADREPAHELSPLLAAVDGLAPVGLEALQEEADLQTRFDRKYIVSPRVAAGMITSGPQRFQVLQIGHLRTFRYESVYFDTPDLASYFGAARSRRQRFKVRTRTYVDSALCVLEVKTSGGRGETVKERQDHALPSRALLDADSHEFISGLVPDLDPRTLSAALTTTYRRATLLDSSGARVTLDSGLECSLPTGEKSNDLTGVIIETKSTGHTTAADRWLWRRGIRPVRVSKYAVGLARLVPGLPANKWNRTLRTHFGWSPTS